METYEIHSHEKNFHNPKNYFLAHSLGAMPRTLEKDLEHSFYSKWKTYGGQSWPEWLVEIQKFQQELSKVFHSKEEQFCLTANVTDGLYKIFSCFSLNKLSKLKILLTEEDFSSVSFALQSFKAFGASFVFIPKGEPLYDFEVWKKYLDQGVDFLFCDPCLFQYSRKSSFRRNNKICQN
jgi:kynureninase